MNEFESCPNCGHDISYPEFDGYQMVEQLHNCRSDVIYRDEHGDVWIQAKVSDGAVALTGDIKELLLDEWGIDE